MTAGTCSATVTVVGLGTFTCVDRAGHDSYHETTIPRGRSHWQMVTFAKDGATIAPPGSRRGRP